MKLSAIIISALLPLSAPLYITTASAQTVAHTQQGTVSGVVYDEQGEPVIGATVRVKGESNVATVTDLEGRFNIRAAVGSDLEVSYVGYSSKTVKVEGKKDITIHIVPAATSLDEMVVVGYGQQKKESLTGAISQVKGDEVYDNRGITNTVVALQGEIPGLVIERLSTRPTDPNINRVQIRGEYSINGSDPLILIDGQASSIDDLNNMNGGDIENISVLKDASAAIYGARAAGGVILVTTKRGKVGKPKVTYQGTYSRTVDGYKIPLANAKEWLEMFYEAQYQDCKANNPTITDSDEIHKRVDWWVLNSFGGDPVAKDPTTGEWKLTGEEKVYGESLWTKLHNGERFNLQRGNFIDCWDGNSSLQDALYGNADTWKHAVSISGGDQQFNYRASLNYSQAQSQLKVAEDSEKKYGGHLNADYRPNDIFSIQTGASYEVRKLHTPNAAVGNAWQDPWFWPITNENGDPYDTFSGNRNPYGYLVDAGTNKANWTTTKFNGRITLDFSRWVDGLSISGTGNYKDVNWHNQTHATITRFYDWVGTQISENGAPGGLTEEDKRWKAYTLGGFVNYNRLFKDVHKVDVMVGITGDTEDYKRIKVAKNKGDMYADSGLSDLDTTLGGDNNTAEGGQSSWSFLSYVADLRYSYNDTYLIQLLGRRDGSSKLTPKQRWKNFFSVSAGWVFTNEKFITENPIEEWLSFGKLRYNFGKTGSINGIGNYESYSNIKTGSIYLGGSNLPTAWVDGMTSNERTWETIKQHNIGVDLNFFSNRLTASYDWFTKTNDGMFIGVEYPAVLGAGAPKTNNGKLTTHGWELQLKWADRVGNVNYNVGFHLSDAKTKLEKLTTMDDKPFDGYNNTRIIGKPLSAIYVFQTDGLFQTQEEVDAYYEMFYWNADHTGPKTGNILPAPGEAGTGRLRPGARRRVDINGDGAITMDDIYYAGDAAPRFSYGLKLGADWMGFDFSAFFQGIWKQVSIHYNSLAFPFQTNYRAVSNHFLGKTWSIENPDAEYPVMSRDNGFNWYNYGNNDAQLQDNKYIRLKNLTVGYTIPREITRKAGVDKFRIYFSGDDLWTWTKVNDGFDPEYGNNANNTFPLCRYINFGVDLTF